MDEAGFELSSNLNDESLDSANELDKLEPKKPTEYDLKMQTSSRKPKKVQL